MRNSLTLCLLIILFSYSCAKDKTAEQTNQNSNSQLTQNSSSIMANQPTTANYHYLIGEVATIHLSGTTQKAKIDDSLMESDTVLTGANSMALLRIKDIALFRVLANSKALIRSILDRFELEADDGDFYFKVKKLPKDYTFFIRTTGIIVGVRGTTLHVSQRKGVTRVSVAEGQVELSTREAPDKKVLIEAGSAAEAKFVKAKLVIYDKLPLNETEKLIYQELADKNLDSVTQNSNLQQEEEELYRQIEKDEKPNTKGNLKPKNISTNTKKEQEKEPEVKKEEEKPAKMTIQEIKEKFKTINEFTLFSGKIIRGGIVKSDDNQYVIMTENGELKIPKSQIKGMKVVQ